MLRQATGMGENMSIKYQVREYLLRVEKARKQMIGPSLIQLGLTPGQGQARILNFLLKKDHITQKELSDICTLDVTTTSRNLDKLEKMGFLKREINPNCRRSFLICLTEKGRTEAEKIDTLFNNMDITICNGIDEAELHSFCLTLQKICTNLEKAEN